MKYAYLFEAKSIQSYIFATNKLKEIVGGSELIEQLTSQKGLVTTTLEALNLKQDICFSRCGGAAFYAFSDSKSNIGRLSAVWPLVFRQYAPDMEFIHASGEGDSERAAFENTHTLMLADRNRPKVRMPQATVYTRRFPRTGEPVIKLVNYGKERGIQPQDKVTSRKLEYVRHEGLVGRVSRGSSSNQWPINLTPEVGQDEKNFPFKGSAQVIGLVHADGNGLGQLLMDLKESTKADDTGKVKLNDKHYVEVFKAVSEAIQKATEDAASLAVKEVLEPNKAPASSGVTEALYPARPIVLGGDDLTMIVRADLALPFTQAFLHAFEKTSRSELKKVKEKDACKGLQEVIPDYLTACAGIAYAKSSQPFSLLNNLAEGLCKQAKKVSKLNKIKAHETSKTADVIPSSISFHRVTSALVDDYKSILENELTFGNTQLSRTCYLLTDDERLPVHLPTLPDLLALQKLLKNSEGLRGALRQILGMLHQSPDQAQRRYARLKEIMQAREKEAKVSSEVTWSEFFGLFKRLSITQAISENDQAEKPSTLDDFDIDKAQALPFEDVLSLLSVGNDLETFSAQENKS